MSSRELTEWRAYWRIEPWGEERADLRSAIVAHTMASIHAKRGRAPKLESFMPFHKQAKRASSVEEQARLAMAQLGIPAKRD